jgi:hypothetical protein
MWEQGEFYEELWLENIKGGDHLEDGQRCKDSIKIDDKKFWRVWD